MTTKDFKLEQLVNGDYVITFFPGKLNQSHVKLTYDQMQALWIEIQDCTWKIYDYAEKDNNDNE